MNVLTVGTFDLLHSGHVNLINRCYKLAGSSGKVIVGVNTDEFVFSYKKINPVIPFRDRVSVLRAFMKVHEVIENSDHCLKKLLQTIKPHILAIGSDWAKKDYYKQIGVTQDWLDNNDILLVYLPYTEEVSSSIIRQNIHG